MMEIKFQVDGLEHTCRQFIMKHQYYLLIIPDGSFDAKHFQNDISLICPRLDLELTSDPYLSLMGTGTWPC